MCKGYGKLEKLCRRVVSCVSLVVIAVRDSMVVLVGNMSLEPVETFRCTRTRRAFTLDMRSMEKGQVTSVDQRAEHWKILECLC
ncbi:hypothetical protein CFP56_016933 [Quercus suber]|uniref:Uncharacterized protein n=1 Tax=Quercus suber TaxID=58331 RepID=A0AAW0KMK5_QUESU